MKTMRRLFIVAVILAVPASARANGLIYNLPADGAKAVYDMTMESKKRNMMITGTLSISSVGKAKAGGKDCRWIEVAMKMSFMGQERTITAKILVPEEDLGKGKNPFKNPQKGWLWMQGRDPKQIADFSGRDAGPLPAFLAGPLSEQKKLEPKEIDTGLGKLKCAGVTGKHTYKQANNDVAIDYTTRLSDKSPFGVAHTKMNLKEMRDGNVREEVELTFTLKSVGKDAKSKLPDKK